MVNSLDEISALQVSRNKAYIGNWVFFIHHRLVTWLAFCISSVISLRQYIGDPIICDSDGIDPGSINAYCWGKTYNILELFDQRMKDEVVQPGIGPFDRRVHTKVYNDMYQLMPFVIVMIGAIYYIPNLIWKSLERRELDSMTRMVMLQADTHKGSHNHNVWLSQMKFHFSRKNRNVCNNYALKFLVCELLNVIVTIGLGCFMQYFTSERFVGLGPAVFNYWTDKNPVHPMSPKHVYEDLLVMFPNAASCFYSEHGPSGTRQRIYALCTLPHSFMFRGIILGLWYLMVFLLIISSFQFICTIMSFFIMPNIKRYFKIGKKVGTDELSFGQKFRLDLIGRTVPYENFTALLALLPKVDDIEEKEETKPLCNCKVV